MKKLATLLLALILSLPLVVRGQSIQSPQGFAGTAYDATVALYGTKRGRTEFLCTAWNYKQVPGGYDFVAAGHCVGDVQADSYSIADTIGGSLTPVSVVKWIDGQGMDFSIFEMKTTKQYPVLELGTITDQHIGDSIVNPNFAMGITKFLSLGRISGNIVPSSNPDFVSIYPVEVDGAGGSSGSPVISATTHKVIGIVIYSPPTDEEGIPAQLGCGVEPIDYFAKFLTTDVKPAPSISDQEFKEKFGPEHSFKLTVQGVNPTFIVGGHTFKVDTGIGLGLSDEYYYDVPVYIDKRDDGYWLVSTKDAPNYGVEVKLIS